MLAVGIAGLNNASAPSDTTPHVLVLKSRNAALMMSALGHGEKNSRRAYVFRTASDSYRKQAVPALTFIARSGHSGAGGFTNMAASVSAPVAQRIDQQGKGRGGLPSAGVIEVVA